jgi:histidinol-phosphate aminotransferase
MNPFVRKIRENVRAIAPYALEHVDAAIKLDMNENPIDTPQAIKDAVLEKLRTRQWTRYPDLIPGAMLDKLSAFVGWPRAGLLVGNGSNEILKTILTAVADSTTRVAVVQPSFSVYRQLVTLAGAQYSEVLLSPMLEFDVEAMCAAAQDSDLTIMCVPNNPTGTLLELDAIRTILRAASGLVVLDEAYYEFSGQSSLALLKEFQNLVLLRTFSKAMAMAGLRVGYLLCDPALAIEIGKAKLPYNLNFVSIAAAEAALDHIALLQANVNRVIELREALSAGLKEIEGVEVFPSGANFILFRTPRPASALFEALYAQSILIRNVSKAPLLGRCLRVTVGSPAENEQFLKALRKSLRQDQMKLTETKTEDPGIF